MSFRVFFLVEEIKHLSLPSCSHVLIAATSSAYMASSPAPHMATSPFANKLYLYVFFVSGFVSFPGSFSLTRGSSLSICKAANLSVFTKNPVAVSHQSSLGIRAVAYLQ
jgi:hypothetical protein